MNVKKNEFNKLIGLSLGAYTIAGFTYAMGLISKNQIMLLIFYVLSIFLMIIPILALYKNYQKRLRVKLLIYLIIIGIILISLITVSFFTSI